MVIITAIRSDDNRHTGNGARLVACLTGDWPRQGAVTIVSD